MSSDLEKETTANSHAWDLEKDSGFDASPNSAREPSKITRRTTNGDPRSPLQRWTTSRQQDYVFSPPTTRQTTDLDVIVHFDGPDDPYRPINWNTRKKVVTVLLYGLTTACATWNSSIYSTTTTTISQDYHVADVVSTLGITLFMMGFGTGPLLWAPLSEVFGRRVAVFYPYFIGACFTFAVGVSKDLQSILICRFFAGFFCSAPVTNTGGVLGDLFSPPQRAAALAGYSMAVAGGPLLSPIVGGAIAASGTNWRWTEYITGIMMLTVLFFDFLILDESYANTLLVYKARRLRHETNNWAIHAKHEEWDVTLSEMAHKYLLRPFQLLATPICFMMAIYASFVYAIVYMMFAAFPIEFEQERGWNPLVGSLPFIATLIGAVIGAACNVLNTPFYIRKVKENGGRPLPEARLPPMMLGAFLFPAGLFLFGWTSSKDISWVGPCFGALLFGWGFLMIFQCSLNYTIDTFQVWAASAVAANTSLRSLLSGVFPLFAAPMFHNLGIPWASSLLAFLAVGMIPIPFLFYYYGRAIRARGKWSRDSTL